ncbi:MAG: hypothetical protein EZS28_020941 [Streblomastix strix]|uniref:TmcB/TmcC TPR repeats domain-containing protein n=1 Tax=Streblomastix strix TaxID=222440 RepID=A0A5J4VMN1_9EUKA|nr:MAG: hypothetical protein EZS28_020941 [Streblomastix strix]
MNHKNTEVPYIIPKIKKVSHIDASVRFVWNKEVRRRKDYKDFANYVYLEGLKRFPKHPTLRVHYALFLFHYMKDWEAGMKQMTIAQKLGATIDNRWIIFYMSKIYEQTKSGADLKSADILSLFRYKNHLTLAEQNYKDAREKLTDALTILANIRERKKDASAAEQDIQDVLQLSNLLDEIISHEKESEEHYQALLESHPFSIPVLRGYASLLTDIFRYDSEAEIMYKKANDIEEELIRKNPEENIMVGRKRGTKNQVGARKAKAFGWTKKAQQINKDYYTQTKSNSDKVTSQFQMYILAYAAPVSVILFFVLAVILFAVILFRTGDIEMNLQLLSDMCNADRLICELAYLTKMYEMYTDETYLTFDEVLYRMQDRANVLHDTTVNNIFQKVSNLIDWQDLSITTFVSVHLNGVMIHQQAQDQALINAINSYSFDLLLLSQQGGEMQSDSKLDTIMQSLINGPTALAEGMKNAIITFEENMNRQNSEMIIISIVMMAAGITFAIVFGITLYLLLTKLNKQRIEILRFILSIRTNVLRAMRVRLAYVDDLEKGDSNDIEKVWQNMNKKVQNERMNNFKKLNNVFSQLKVNLTPNQRHGNQQQSVQGKADKIQQLIIMECHKN